MAVTDLIPRICWHEPVVRRTSSGTTNPLAAFHDGMNRLCEDFSGLFDDGMLTLQARRVEKHDPPDE